MRPKLKITRLPTPEKILDSRNTHEKKFGTHEIPTKARWHDGTRPTRPTMVRDLRNLAHSQTTHISIRIIRFAVLLV